MTRGTLALRALAAVALWSGFALGSARQWLLSLLASVSPQRGWRVLEAENLQLRVPRSWGDMEEDPAGGVVIHNRPRRFRVDGDAIWYASAVELRIQPSGYLPPQLSQAMTTYRRTIRNGSAEVLIELAIANGVGRAQRRIAQRVLNSARLRGGRKLMLAEKMIAAGSSTKHRQEP
jgi:hypothetical protein